MHLQPIVVIVWYAFNMQAQFRPFMDTIMSRNQKKCLIIVDIHNTIVVDYCSCLISGRNVICIKYVYVTDVKKYQAGSILFFMQKVT